MKAKEWDVLKGVRKHEGKYSTLCPECVIKEDMNTVNTRTRGERNKGVKNVTADASESISRECTNRPIKY